jgi:hypothetical protein
MRDDTVAEFSYRSDTCDLPSGLARAAVEFA